MSMSQKATAHMGKFSSVCSGPHTALGPPPSHACSFIQFLYSATISHTLPPSLPDSFIHRKHENVLAPLLCMPCGELMGLPNCLGMHYDYDYTLLLAVGRRLLRTPDSGLQTHRTETPSAAYSLPRDASIWIL